MHTKSILCAAYIVAGIGFSDPSAAGVLYQTNASGTLMGVQGVQVGGLSYDVRFGDGTCNAYSDCGSNPMAYRLGVTSDLAFSTALLEQVFGGGSADSVFYTNNPDRINGCEFEMLCEIWSPIRIESNQNGPYLVAETVANWNPIYAEDSVGLGQAVLYYNFSSSVHTFAVWGSGYVSVPEPSTLGLTGLAIGLLGAAGRSRSRRAGGVRICEA